MDRDKRNFQRRDQEEEENATTIILRKAPATVTPWEVVQQALVLYISTSEEEEEEEEEFILGVSDESADNNRSFLNTSYPREATYNDAGEASAIPFTDELVARARALLSLLPSAELSSPVVAAMELLEQTCAASARDLGFQRDWNQGDERVLLDDFVNTALTYGKIIIDEVPIPNREKTIKEARKLGGLIGGKKFLHHGILFKLSMSSVSSKGASHELSSLKAVRDTVEEIHTPLFCVIHYKGYTISAQTVVPISRLTLIHGSSDGGATFSKDEAMNRRLEETIGKRFAIATHLCSNQVQLCGPADAEIHRTAGGDLYAIDFHRLAPPTSRQRCLEHLFRFEFLEWYAGQNDLPRLSSDSFSAFNSEEKKFDPYLHEAIALLFSNRLPDLIKKLNASKQVLQGQELIDLMHKYGINVRFLPKLCSLTKGQVQRAVNAELCARLLKAFIWGKQREVSIEPLASGKRHVVVAVEILNDAFENKITFWEKLESLQNVFETIPDLEDLRTCVDLNLIMRTCRLSGVWPKKNEILKGPFKSQDFECVARLKTNFM
jgi:hypothetical protein